MVVVLFCRNLTFLLSTRNVVCCACYCTYRAQGRTIAAHLLFIIVMAAADSNGMGVVVGPKGMASLEDIAVRVNSSILAQFGNESAVRIVGKLAIDGDHMRLTATDGGSVAIRGLVGDGVEGLDGSFVEVVGRKSGDASVYAVGCVGLGEEVDVQLCDEAVKLLRHPRFICVF